MIYIYLVGVILNLLVEILAVIIDLRHGKSFYLIDLISYIVTLPICYATSIALLIDLIIRYGKDIIIIKA